MKIISESCGASVRKCLRGLDNYLADGTKAFDELRCIVEKLSHSVLKEEHVKYLIEWLAEAKQYLKGDFKVRTFCT